MLNAPDRPTIRLAIFPEDWATVADLFREYIGNLRIDLAFQQFDEEVAGLPGRYAPPGGRLLLAYVGSTPAGCAAFRPMSVDNCEIKRLYVRPAQRGKGIGQRLIQQLIEGAREAGYKRVFLDTLPSMREAIALYESFGFRETEPYCDNPIPEARFMLLELKCDPIAQRWLHCTASSSDSPAGLPRTMGWDEAQTWCNFVLMKPRSLPGSLSIVSAEMRPEAPPGRAVGTTSEKRPTWTSSNRACHRTVISNHEATVRIKQFLYDWAPPAFDHPSLWRSRPRPRSFRVGYDIGWTGTDFRGRPAAAIQIDRTTVEIAVIRGCLDDEGLQSICRGLGPVSMTARQRIVATPLAALCYQARHVEATVEVPTGYWRHQRDARKLLATALPAAAAPMDLPGRRVAPKSNTGYKLDSVFIYRDAESGEVVEADFVYEMPGNPGRYLRILASWLETTGGLQYPPALDEQECNFALRQDPGADAYHAYLEDVGPHEVLWQQRNENILLLCKPTSWTDQQWLKKLLADLIRPTA